MIADARSAHQQLPRSPTGWEGPKNVIFTHSHPRFAVTIFKLTVNLDPLKTQKWPLKYKNLEYTPALKSDRVWWSYMPYKRRTTQNQFSRIARIAIERKRKFTRSFFWGPELQMHFSRKLGQICQKEKNFFIIVVFREFSRGAIS